MVGKNQNNNSGHVTMKFACECQIAVSVAMASVAQWLSRHSVHQEVAG